MKTGEGGKKKRNAIPKTPNFHELIQTPDTDIWLLLTPKLLLVCMLWAPLVPLSNRFLEFLKNGNRSHSYIYAGRLNTFSLPYAYV